MNLWTIIIGLAALVAGLIFGSQNKSREIITRTITKYKPKQKSEKLNPPLTQVPSNRTPTKEEIAELEERIKGL